MYEDDENNEDLSGEALQENLQAPLMGKLIENYMLERTGIRTFEDTGIMTYTTKTRSSGHSTALNRYCGGLVSEAW